MENKNLEAEESFAIITNMIETAKHKLADDGFYFIFWGWLTTICSLTHYFVLKAGIQNGHYVWVILMPLGSIVSMYYGYKQDKTKKVKTYVDSYLNYIWIAFLTGLFLTLILMPWNGYKHSYFFIMMLYGISTFITGGLLQFKPLMFGSFFAFAFAALSVFLPPVDMFLCISGALLCSHIIPGYLLRSAFKSQNV